MLLAGVTEALFAVGRGYWRDIELDRVLRKIACGMLRHTLDIYLSPPVPREQLGRTCRKNEPEGGVGCCGMTSSWPDTADALLNFICDHKSGPVTILSWTRE